MFKKNLLFRNFQAAKRPAPVAPKKVGAKESNGGATPAKRGRGRPPKKSRAGAKGKGRPPAKKAESNDDKEEDESEGDDE